MEARHFECKSYLSNSHGVTGGVIVSATVSADGNSWTGEAKYSYTKE